MQIRVAYLLSDCLVPDAGNTLLAPGSHRALGPLETVNPGTADPPGALEPMLRAGDAFLWENRLFHRQGLNFQPQTRKAIMFGYSYAWLAPNDYVVQDQEWLAQITEPIARQLLGALRKPNTQIDDGPLREWTERHGVRRASEVAAARL